MCGRYTLSTPGEELSEVFGLSEGVEFEPRFNIAPSQMAPIVKEDEEGNRAMQMSRWGLVPYWAKDISIGDRLINARAETVGEKPAYRDSFERRRCLVLADGFYEWRRQGRHKQPFYFSRGSGAPFAMAGLWDRWRHGDEPIESFTVVTTDANSEVAEIHDRMPVVLDEAGWARWLDPSEAGTAEIRRLLTTAPDGFFDSRPVSTLVNSPANDSSRCVEAVDASIDPDGQSRLF